MAESIVSYSEENEDVFEVSLTGSQYRDKEFHDMLALPQPKHQKTLANWHVMYYQLKANLLTSFSCKVHASQRP